MSNIKKFSSVLSKQLLNNPRNAEIIMATTLVAILDILERRLPPTPKKES